MTDHPTPGSPLSAEDVGLLKRGDVCRWNDEVVSVLRVIGTVDIERPNGDVCARIPAADLTFIGRPDADGWISWSGGENPVPGERVEAESEACVYRGLSNEFDWRRGGHFKIFRFRLPTDRRAEADTPPSAGLDAGLELSRCIALIIKANVSTGEGRHWGVDSAVADILKAMTKPCDLEEWEISKHWNPPLVTRQSAAAALEAAAIETARWKSAYDIAHDQATENGSRLNRAEARAADLLKALEPFALLAADEANDVAGVNMSDPISKWLTFAQLVDARLALAATQQQDAGKGVGE